VNTENRENSERHIKLHFQEAPNLFLLSCGFFTEYDDGLHLKQPGFLLYKIYD